MCRDKNNRDLRVIGNQLALEFDATHPPACGRRAAGSLSFQVDRNSGTLRLKRTFSLRTPTELSNRLRPSRIDSSSSTIEILMGIATYENDDQCGKNPLYFRIYYFDINLQRQKRPPCAAVAHLRQHNGCT